MTSPQIITLARNQDRKKQQEWLEQFRGKWNIQDTMRMIQEAKRSDTNFARSVEEMGQIVDAIQNDMAYVRVNAVVPRYIKDVVPNMKKFYES